MNPTRPCPICQCASPRFLFRKNACDLYACPDCAFSFVATLPTTEEIQTLHDDSYFLGAPSKFGYHDYCAEKSNRTRAFDTKIKFLREQFPSGGRLLDIGCADGSFLEMLPPAWKAEGVELSESIWQKIHPRLQPQVFRGFFEDFPGQDSSYDVVTMWDVLDHVQDPLSTLQKASRLLKPGGYLGMVTGDRCSWLARLMGRYWYLYVPPVHLSYFTPSAVRHAMTKSGLTEVRIQYEGKWVSLPLIAYRIAHLFPNKRWEAFFMAVSDRMPDSLNFEINFFDVMAIWARKPRAN